MIRSKVHPSNLLYLGGCLFVIIAVFMVIIYPNITMLRETDEEIQSLSRKVQTQELLYPVYLHLLAEITNKIATKLPVPESQKIANNDLGRINETFRAMAEENNVSFIDAIPDARTYLEDMGFLSMKVTFAGDFFDLRALLLVVCRLPYLESIDEMRMETFNKEKRLSFKIKVAQG
ncbi:MAG: hypothetical protein PVH87_09830 [Desulfobacteraceae bacterium]|jgi:hypothetical protein